MSGPFKQPFKTIGNVTLNMYLFRPDEGADRAGRPAIVFFFCGGWRGFDATKFYPQSTYLASRGMVCLNAEVRVGPEHGTTPTECVVDSKSAIRYVRAHASELGVDPDRIVAAGGSAAGHVSACCGVVEGFDEAGEDLSVGSRPDAMVLFNPALDTTDLERRVALFGGMDRARALSPVHQVKPGAPPALVMHGRADEVVDVGQAVRFEEAMAAAGNRCDLRLYDGQGHGFFNFRDGNNPMFTETLRETDRFLASLGYLDGDGCVDSFRYTPI